MSVVGANLINYSECAPFRLLFILFLHGGRAKMPCGGPRFQPPPSTVQTPLFFFCCQYKLFVHLQQAVCCNATSRL